MASAIAAFVYVLICFMVVATVIVGGFMFGPLGAIVPLFIGTWLACWAIIVA